MDVQKALTQLRDEVLRLLRARIGKYGINPKTKTNTLQGSSLEDSIEVDTFEYGITLQIADYWEYVALGWRRTGRFPGTMAQFVENIDNWVTRKGIRLGRMKQSTLVYLIIRNIMEKGLRARPFMVYDPEGDLTAMIPELEAYMDEWIDSLFNDIISEIDNFFN